MVIIWFLRKIFALTLALVMFIGVKPNGAEPYTVLDEENCLLNVTILSDVHIEGNNLARYNVYGTILKDVKNCSYGSDAVLYLGDNTMNGQDIESLLFYGATAKEKLSDNVFLCCGNHDVGNGEGDYNKLFDRFAGYNRTFFGNDIEKPYYYRIVNGYYFIVLGPEDLCVSEFPISDEQLDFLDETLKLATADGKPAFVCAHHPYDYIEDEAYDRIYDILTSYDNVFYLSGHTHMFPFNGWTFGSWYGINEINLPRCTELAGEGDNETFWGTGYGVQMEVYEDEVVGRVRNYYTGEWDEELVYHFDLVG